MSRELERVRQAASRDQRERFTALLHHGYDVGACEQPTLGLKQSSSRDGRGDMAAVRGASRRRIFRI